MEVPTRNTILTLYRQLLKTSKRIRAKDERMESMKEIQSKFRENINSSDSEAIRKMLDLAQSRLGYLKIVTPKERPAAGKSSYVMRDGKLVENDDSSNPDRVVKSWDMSEVRARHKYLTERQYFMHRK